MPTPPKPVDPNHRIDPSRNGDGHAVQHPTRHQDGSPITQQPLRDHRGRDIPPGRDHLGHIDRPDIRHNIHDVQDRWDHNDHGYHWHDWNGMRVAHHYDDFGYHWWGFYVGSSYFWTRYYDDNYWWYDPYWHRWCSMHQGQWWWQSPDGVIYVYTGDGYYQYDSSDSGVIMVPDPTPPVDVPPGDPAPANQTSVYSLDGTRSIQITGENRDAYLYDLTVADPQSDAAKGRYIGTQVAGVNIIYVTSTADDGTETQAIQQIELSYDDSSSVSIVDLNGERRVDISDDAQDAVLINLDDSTVEPVLLAAGATGAAMNYMNVTDENGAPVQSLLSITLTVAAETGGETTVSFDRDGAALNTSSFQTVPESATRALPPTPAPAAIKTLQQKMEGSETFRALKSGFGW